MSDQSKAVRKGRRSKELFSALTRAAVSRPLVAQKIVARQQGPTALDIGGMVPRLPSMDWRGNLIANHKAEIVRLREEVEFEQPPARTSRRDYR